MSEVVPFRPGEPGRKRAGKTTALPVRKGRAVRAAQAGNNAGADGQDTRSAQAARDAALHPRTRRAAPEARALAADQAAADRERYTAAARRARTEKLLAGGKVVPARITIALDIRGLDGPEVDEQVGTWHGNPDGDVDRWEQALAVPSAEQVKLLAKLADFPVAWFYEPLEPGPTPGDGPAWMCFGGRRGCTQVQPDVITADGVLLYEGQPREPVDTCSAPLPGMPAPEAPQPRKRVPAAPAAGRKPAARKKPTPVVQPTLPTRMPEHLRAELDEKLAAARRRRR